MKRCQILHVIGSDCLNPCTEKDYEASFRLKNRGTILMMNTVIAYGGLEHIFVISV